MKNDYRDYLAHSIWKKHKYIRKEGDRYIYPNDISTKTYLGKKVKKLYEQTVAYKQAQADRDARSDLVVKDITTGKKISNNVYVDHKDNFNIPDTYKRNQTGVTTYWKDSKGNKHSNRIQFNTNDDNITRKDLIDTIRRNVKNKVNYKKFKNRKKFENFLEKYLGYKDPRKVKSEIENREFNNRINKKMAEEYEQKFKRDMQNKTKKVGKKTFTSLFKKLDKNTNKKRTINIIKGTSHGKGNRG